MEIDIISVFTIKIINNSRKAQLFFQRPAAVTRHHFFGQLFDHGIMRHTSGTDKLLQRTAHPIIYVNKHET